MEEVKLKLCEEDIEENVQDQGLGEEFWDQKHDP